MNVVSAGDLPTAEGHDVENGKATYILGADLADVEMEDDFLPLIPAITVSIL